MSDIDESSESVKFKKISASKIARSEILPDGVDSLSPEDVSLVENRICDAWVRYMENLKSKRFALVNHTEKAVKVLLAIWSSRYHVNGQAKQKRHIKKALGHYYFKFGVMLTLTFDPNKMTKLSAWSDLGYEVRDFIDKVNKWWKARGLSKIVLPWNRQPKPFVCPQKSIGIMNIITVNHGPNGKVLKNI
jgi:hypothetical protein